MLTRKNLTFYSYNLEYAWANVHYYADYDIFCEVSEDVSIDKNPQVKHYLRDFLNGIIS